MTEDTGTTTYTYDGDGREATVTTSGGTTTLSYDDKSRLTSIANPGGSTHTYAYNGLDTRVAKNEGTSQTYRRDGVGVTSPVLSDSISEFTPCVSQRATATTVNHADQLGSFVAQTNSSQSVTATRQFDAFGMLVSSTGAPTEPLGFAGCDGYQSDTSGLVLLGHRYYDATTGRFLTRDPTQDGRNWYEYCDNSPLSAVDPAGQVPEWLKKVAGYGWDGYQKVTKVVTWPVKIASGLVMAAIVYTAASVHTTHPAPPVYVPQVPIVKIRMRGSGGEPKVAGVGASDPDSQIKLRAHMYDDDNNSP